jgi:hypothetical protein
MSVLSGTSFRKPFNDVLDLIPKCEKVKQLQAICKICSYPASFTLRTTASEEIELIGGGDLYMPVCRECFNFKTQQQEKRERANQLEVIKFKDDAGEEDSLLVVKKTPSKNTPGQPGD